MVMISEKELEINGLTTISEEDLNKVSDFLHIKLGKELNFIVLMLKTLSFLTNRPRNRIVAKALIDLAYKEYEDLSPHEKKFMEAYLKKAEEVYPTLERQ